MAAIALSGFLGMIPSGNPLLIADAASVHCSNAFSRFGDLRPVSDDNEVSTVSDTDPKTLYRMSRQSDGSPYVGGAYGWITHSTVVNYVRGPVAGDNTERTYYTGDGAPKVRTIDESIRPLGIPSPLYMPSVTVLAVDQMTPEQVSESYSAAIVSAVDSIKANLTYGDDTRITPEAITGGVVDESNGKYMVWTLPNNAENAYLLLQSIGGYKFEGDGDDICLKVPCRPSVSSLNESALIADLEMLVRPDDDGTGPNEAGPLLTTEQIDKIIANIKQSVTADCPWVIAKIKDLESEFAGLYRIVVSGQAVSASYAAVQAFYETPAVVVAIENAKIAFLNTAGAMAGTVSTDSEWNTTILPADTAALKDLIGGYIQTQGDGSLALDSTSVRDILSNWLLMSHSISESDIVPSTYLAGGREKAEAIIDKAVNDLSAAIAVSTWKNSPGFPSNESSVESAGIPAAIRGHLDRMLTICNEIESNESRAIDPEQVKSFITLVFADSVLPTYPAGVTLIESTYTYVFTWVSDWGEESEPSPPSELVTCDQNDSRQIEITETPPDNVVGVRLYRSNTGTVSSAFQLQGEYSVGGGALSINDALSAEYLDEVCPSFGWSPPHPLLSGLAGLPNGILAGFFGRSLFFCEPYKPYAWPVDYEKPLPTNIIGLGAFGQTLFVGTEGKPYVVSGVDSGSMTEQLLEFEQACSSARSIVSFGVGVAYASPDGLCIIANGAAPSVVTKGIMSAEKWRSYSPESMFGAFHDNRIYMFCESIALVWDFEMQQLYELDVQASSAFVDSINDVLYFTSGTTVFSLFGGPGRRIAQWFSKTFHFSRPVCMSWLNVYSGFESPVTVRVYGDGTLKHSHVVSSGSPLRLPPGLHHDWRLEIETAADVVFVTTASSTPELQAAP